MDKYVHIFYDKLNQTQRFVLAGSNDCLAGIERKLNKMNISYTGQKFIGKYEPLKDFKDNTYKNAKKWKWLYTIDLTREINY